MFLIVPVLFLISGCSVSFFNGYQKDPLYVGGDPVSWFRTDSGHFLFNTKIDMMKNHLSGLMVIKPLASGSCRVVFITGVGLKLFDMEFFPEKPVQVHYIIDAMNRRALVNTLTNDLELVLMTRVKARKPGVLRHRHSQDIVFRYRDKGRKNDYTVALPDERPYQALQTAGIFRKVKADFSGSVPAGLDSVKIDHFNIRLKINLYRIIEENNHVGK